MIMGITALIKTDLHVTGERCGEAERGRRKAERHSYQKGAEMDGQRGEEYEETFPLQKRITQPFSREPFPLVSE